MTWIVTFGLLILFGSIGKALSANAEVDRYVDQDLRTFPVGGGVHIYKGALVGIDPAGCLKAFVPGDRFVGVAYEEVNNTGVAGALTCRVFTVGDFEYTLTSVALTDVGKAAYATADDGLALTGHPDAYVGRIVNYVATNTCIVRLRGVGEAAPADGTCIDIDLDFAAAQIANQDEATATLKVAGSGIKTAAGGAGLTAGTTGILTDEATGEIRLLIDNDNEAEYLSVQTPQVFLASKGVTFEFTGRVKTAGNNTDDADWGLFGLAGGITATEMANMQATTAGASAALFHQDTEDLNVDAYSDDNATVVGVSDTTIDASLTVNKNYKIIVRPSGVCEFWIDGARVLSSTVFAVAAAALLCGVVNLEKSAGTGVPEMRLRRMRVAGALA